MPSMQRSESANHVDGNLRLRRTIVVRTVGGEELGPTTERFVCARPSLITSSRTLGGTPPPRNVLLAPRSIRQKHLRDGGRPGIPYTLGYPSGLCPCPAPGDLSLRRDHLVQHRRGTRAEGDAATVRGRDRMRAGRQFRRREARL